MPGRTLSIGLIGYQFMGKAHSNAYRQVGRFFDLPLSVRMKTICGRNSAAVSQAASRLGWEGYETDWRKVVDDPEIDVIDVSTPGNSHCEIACAAAATGKIVFCEKPLANTVEEAQKMFDAVRSAHTMHAIFHNYRKAPAVALAKKLIDEGRIGRIYHFRAVYLQDWIADPEFPLVWRLQKSHAGSGAHGDIHSHIIDLARYLVGEIHEVSAVLETFIKERPIAGAVDDKLSATKTSERGVVDVDDAAAMIARFECGALGTFEATRFAVGRKNHNRFEINGANGSLCFNLERMNELEFYDNLDRDGERGFRLIQATEATHPYAGRYWPVGHIIGYEHTFTNLLADAVTAIGEGKCPTPNFEDGLLNQRVLDAAERSWTSRSWQRVETKLPG